MANKGPVQDLEEQISCHAIQLLAAARPMDFQIILGKLLEKAEVLKLLKERP